MIRVDKVKANEDSRIGKFSLTKGELYWVRQSKDGNSKVVWCNEGYWIPIIFRSYTNVFEKQKWFDKQFTLVETVYVNNYVQMKQLCETKG